MEIIKDIEQNSEEWFQLRLGSIGGSSIAKAVAKGQGKSRKDLLYKLAGEILTGVPAPSFKFQHADRGHEHEDDARGAYEFNHGVVVEQVSMIKNGHRKHCSPDGLVGDDGMVEIKTRIPSVFIEAMESGKIPTSDKRQMQWSLSRSERRYCDYVQYCPEMKKNKLLVIRIARDEKLIKELEEGADSFLHDLDSLVAKYQ